MRVPKRTIIKNHERRVTLANLQVQLTVHAINYSGNEEVKCIHNTKAFINNKIVITFLMRALPEKKAMLHYVLKKKYLDGHNSEILGS